MKSLLYFWKPISIFALFLAALITTYYFYAHQKKIENQANRIKGLLIASVENAYSHIPVPPKSTLIHTYIRGNWKDEYSRLEAIYISDHSPADICHFYLDYVLENPEWNTRGRCKKAEFTTNPPGRYSYPFAANSKTNTPIKAGIVISLDAQESKIAIPQFFKPLEAFSVARKLGPTIFSLRIYSNSDIQDNIWRCPQGMVIDDVCNDAHWRMPGKWYVTNETYKHAMTQDKNIH